MNGSKENVQFPLRNLEKLGPRVAEKLTRAGIKVSLIDHGARGAQALPTRERESEREEPEEPGSRGKPPPVGLARGGEREVIVP